MKKKHKLPNIDLDELNKQKEDILRERIESAKMYADWLKKNGRKEQK